MGVCKDVGKLEGHAAAQLSLRISRHVRHDGGVLRYQGGCRPDLDDHQEDRRQKAQNRCQCESHVSRTPATLAAAQATEPILARPAQDASVPLGALRIRVVRRMRPFLLHIHIQRRQILEDTRHIPVIRRKRLGSAFVDARALDEAFVKLRRVRRRMPVAIFRDEHRAAEAFRMLLAVQTLGCGLEGVLVVGTWRAGVVQSHFSREAFPRCEVQVHVHLLSVDPPVTELDDGFAVHADASRLVDVDGPVPRAIRLLAEDVRRQGQHHKT